MLFRIVRDHTPGWGKKADPLFKVLCIVNRVPPVTSKLYCSLYVSAPSVAGGIDLDRLLASLHSPHPKTPLKASDDVPLIICILVGPRNRVSIEGRKLVGCQ